MHAKKLSLLVICFGVLTGLAPATKPVRPAGYPLAQPPIDVLKLLPPPPESASPQGIADQNAYAASALGIGGARWAAASTEINPFNPAFFERLSCAVGVALSRDKTPQLFNLVMRSGTEFLSPMDLAKNHYKRLRPFTTDHGKACDALADDGIGEKLGYSYPSGHAGVGWLWALVLADAAPARASQIREFGRDVGDHRVDCRVHYLSDVAAGRTLGVAVYQRISATPAYAEDIAQAKAEIAAQPVLACGK